jgi:ligand-binding sensor domain-containing protein/serine phosphatase RsbU (regulator of sigma subunit)
MYWEGKSGTEAKVRQIYLKFKHMKRIRTAHILFILTLPIWLITSFTSYTSAQILHFKNYTIKEGLPQNTVLSVYQDNKGFIWIGTQGGVSRFDGKNFENFSVNEGLANNYITHITEDRKGNIWISTKENGISVFNGHNFKNITKNEGLISNGIEEIVIDKSDKKYCRSREGLSIISPNGDIENITTNNGLISNVIKCIFLRQNGTLWIGTRAGITILGKQKIHSFTTDNGLTNNTIWDITEDSHRNIWIATQGGGVLKYSQKHFTPFTSKQGLGSDIVLNLLADSTNTIWCGTYGKGLYAIRGNKIIDYNKAPLLNKTITDIQLGLGKQLWVKTSGDEGLFCIENKKTAHYTSVNGLIDNYLLKIYPDNNKNLWVGTAGGLSLFNTSPFSVFNTIHGLPDNKIFSVLAQQNTILFGTYNGLFSFKNNNFSPHKVNKQLENKTILCLASDSNNNLYIGTYSGLTIYSNNNTTKHFSIKDGLPDNTINDIKVKNTNNIWLATEKGLVHFNGTHFKTFTTKNGLVNNYCRTLETHKQKLWIGTQGGLSVMDSSGFQNFTNKNGLPSNVCRDIASDSTGGTWVATESGLCCFQLKGTTYTIHCFSKKNGLISNNIYSIATDTTDQLWIGMENGTHIMEIKTGKLRYFGLQEGFFPLENNTGAISIDRQNGVWFGTMDGLVHYNPLEDKASPNSPVTYIRKVSILNDSTKISSFADSIAEKSQMPIGLDLPFNKNSIRFEFAGLHFKNPQKNLFSYKLEGFDTEWSLPSEKTFAVYKKLPSGKYTFLVKSMNSDGIWNKIPKNYKFMVSPPFYKSWWFYCIELFFIIMTIYLYIKIRERNLLREKAILEQKVVIRTKQINEQKEAIEAINEELKEQQVQIIEQRDELAKQKEEITDSIKYAKRIQNAILPPTEYIEQSLPENFIFFKPRDIVSGDFFWIKKIEHFTIWAAADCTGHGVPGAFVSMLGIAFLNEIVRKKHVLQANHILNELRNEIKISLRQTGKEGEAKDGMDISVCVLNSKDMTLQYSGAYNPLYLIRNNSSQKKPDLEKYFDKPESVKAEEDTTHTLFEVKADKMPIGIYIREKESFTNHTIQLLPGDSVYIFSDGFADQFGGEKGGKFKTKPFKRLLLSFQQYTLEEQHKILSNTMEEWKKGHDQVDDITVIGVRV